VRSILAAGVIALALAAAAPAAAITNGKPDGNSHTNVDLS
jgi:hypothetical protein